jgi:hypothetical protein
MDVGGTNLVCVVKRVVHEPSDYARLPDGLIAQKYELILGQWIGARHLRVATFCLLCAQTKILQKGKASSNHPGK